MGKCFLSISCFMFTPQCTTDINTGLPVCVSHTPVMLPCSAKPLLECLYFYLYPFITPETACTAPHTVLQPTARTHTSCTACWEIPVAYTCHLGQDARVTCLSLFKIVSELCFIREETVSEIVNWLKLCCHHHELQWCSCGASTLRFLCSVSPLK